MAKNISLLGADYPDVPAVQLPQTGGGTATFYDINVIDDLTSTSTTDALSANQGKVLNDKFTSVTDSGSYAKWGNLVILYFRNQSVAGLTAVPSEYRNTARYLRFIVVCRDNSLLNGKLGFAEINPTNGNISIMDATTLASITSGYVDGFAVWVK